jgi:hypothetical protein
LPCDGEVTIERTRGVSVRESIDEDRRIQPVKRTAAVECVRQMTESHGPQEIFRWLRVSRPGDLPPVEGRFIDVALLDMNHAWPNLGHDAIVRTVGEIAEDVRPLLEQAGLAVRVLSYDVRRKLQVPEGPGLRHSIYIGTGGPGHLDPRCNDGDAEFSQGIREDPSWEAPLFRLLDSIVDCPQAAFLAVCHSFGVVCRWAGIAQPALRGADKGGKSSGVVTNALTDAARAHPWFSRFASLLQDGRHFRVLDNRLFDLIPTTRMLDQGFTAIAFEAASGQSDDGLTAVEFGAGAGGVMPRFLAVNHHPEIRHRWRQRWLLERKLERGDVTREWYQERARSISAAFSSTEMEHEVMLTSQYTFVAPLRYHLYRQIRLRAEAEGRSAGLHEDIVLLPSGTLEHEEQV